MWSGEPNKALTPQARQFSPKIKHINFPTNLLRLEVNSSFLDYYTELDAVILRGVKERPMLALYKMPLIDISDLSDSEEELSDIGAPFKQGGDGKHQKTGNGYFDKLPYEVSTTNITALKTTLCLLQKHSVAVNVCCQFTHCILVIYCNTLTPVSHSSSFRDT